MITPSAQQHWAAHSNAWVYVAGYELLFRSRLLAQLKTYAVVALVDYKNVTVRFEARAIYHDGSEFTVTSMDWGVTEWFAIGDVRTHVAPVIDDLFEKVLTRYCEGKHTPTAVEAILLGTDVK